MRVSSRRSSETAGFGFVYLVRRPEFFSPQFFRGDVSCDLRSADANYFGGGFHGQLPVFLVSIALHAAIIKQICGLSIAELKKLARAGCPRRYLGGAGGLRGRPTRAKEIASSGVTRLVPPHLDFFLVFWTKRGVKPRTDFHHHA